jgi:hypothetical protein
MKETSLDNWNKSPSRKKDQNIFEIWREIGEKVPFAVRNYRWSDKYYSVVEKIEIGKWPYGKAYGYPTINGQYSDHYERDKRWRQTKQIPLDGCYQWTLVENAIISMDFSILNMEIISQRPADRRRIVSPKKPGAYTFDEIHVNYPKAYAKWNTEDDEKLRDLFPSGKTNEELAAIFQRKVGAIEARRVKLGLKLKDIV